MICRGDTIRFVRSEATANIEAPEEALYRTLVVSSMIMLIEAASFVFTGTFMLVLWFPGIMIK